MKTFMFPGQGSQSKGMGRDLFDEFKELTQKADKILGYSTKELCLDDPGKELNKTQFTQPALYVVNALSWFKKIDSGQKPDFLVGHSLGEFNALLAAECFDFEAGLKLVKKRGELMSLATDGGMAAILNATKEEIESILEKKGLSNIDLANFNTPSQIVISGVKDEIAKTQAFFQEGRMLFYPLNTSGAFHSRYMQPARDEFKSYLKKFKLSGLKIPVISNVTAEPYKDDQIVQLLSEQITNPVRWCESIQYLMQLGASRSDPMEFEEIGHGDVLSKLVQKIQRETRGPSKAEARVEARSGKSNGAADPAGVGVASGAQVKGGRPEDSPRRLSEAEEKVNAWNSNHPIGTKAKSSIVEDPNLETRTEATVLFGHRAAVYMKRYNGYFDLDEITPI